MKLVIQRVAHAKVVVDNNTVSQINQGLLILLGAAATDTSAEIQWLAKKAVELRIFEDENGKMNKSLQDINGEILLVSQFTLYADCRKGRRPSFIDAAPPEIAEKLYLEFAKELKKNGIKPGLGVFGAHMDVSLHNDGPVTIILEK